ncbi:MAG: hypothetical protein V3R70_11325 [Syntrophobacteria bacterium]
MKLLKNLPPFVKGDTGGFQMKFPAAPLKRDFRFATTRPVDEEFD